LLRFGHDVSILQDKLRASGGLGGSLARSHGDESRLEGDPNG
jgi:hypothetical protein